MIRALLRAVLDIGSGGGTQSQRIHHEADIHPNYVEIEATCSCGNVIKTRSTRARTRTSTSAPSATCSTPASRRCWIPAAVSIASSSVSVCSAQVSRHGGNPMRFSEHEKASLVAPFSFHLLQPAGPCAFCPSPGTLPLVGVAKVVDGDTLRLVDGRNVRLIGINTPELGRDARKAEPFAVAAQRRLRARWSRPVMGRPGPRARVKGSLRSYLAHACDEQGRNLESLAGRGPWPDGGDRPQHGAGGLPPACRSSRRVNLTGVAQIDAAFDSHREAGWVRLVAGDGRAGRA